MPTLFLLNLYVCVIFYLVGLQMPSVNNTDWYFVQIIELSRQSSDQIRAVQSPTVRKFFKKLGFRAIEHTGPRCVDILHLKTTELFLMDYYIVKWMNILLVHTRKLIFSIGDLPLRLHTKTIPTSVPHMNFVGIVVSYSKTVTPNDRDTNWSSVLIGSISKRSNGSFNFRVSHLEINSINIFLKIFQMKSLLPNNPSVKRTGEKFSAGFWIYPQNRINSFLMAYFSLADCHQTLFSSRIPSANLSRVKSTNQTCRIFWIVF